MRRQNSLSEPSLPLFSPPAATVAGSGPAMENAGASRPAPPDTAVPSYLKDHRGVGSSYDLPVGLQEVVFDLDSESNLQLALDDMKMLVRYLIADLGVPVEGPFKPDHYRY